jgi:hypothetical protein
MEPQVAAGLAQQAKMGYARAGASSGNEASASGMSVASSFIVGVRAAVGYSRDAFLTSSGFVVGASVAVSASQAMPRTVEKSAEKSGIDPETLEAARVEIRAGIREGFEPLRQLLTAFEGTMRRAIETNEHLRKKRVR